MVNNFRYDSPWEEFTQAVKEVKELVKSKKAFWAIGFLNEFDLFIYDSVAQLMDKKMLNIIYGEITYLLKLGLNQGTLKEEKVRATIESTNMGAPKDELDMMVKSLCNKYEFVADAFDIHNLSMRYNLKKNAISPKLSSFKYNIYTDYMPNGKAIDCALVSMACKKNMDRMSGRKIDEFYDGQGADITFICDEEDLDLWIGELEELKQKIRERQNGDKTRGNK